MTSTLQLLSDNLNQFKVLSASNGFKGFFAKEVLRFHSIAILLKSDLLQFSFDNAPDADERAITHPMARSVIEPFFWILYIFDDPDETEYSKRYE